MLEHLARVDSTNAEARRRVETGRARPPFALLAHSQSAARGRRGHSWTSLPGRSLALTLCLPDPMLARPARAALLVALAVARGCEAWGSSPLAIKWPNDLMRGERKAGGILIETLAAPDGRPSLAIGVGLNLALEPGELSQLSSPPAGDLGLPCDEAARLGLGRALVAQIQDVLARSDDPALSAEYRRRSWLTGRRVRLHTPSGPVEGVLARVSLDGDLALEGGPLLRGEHVSLAALL